MDFKKIPRKSRATDRKDSVEGNAFITRKTCVYLAKAFKYGQHLQAHPFTWNKDTKKLELVKSKLRLAIWFINVFISYAYYVFLLRQVFKVRQDESTKIFAKILLYFALGVFALLPCNQLLIILRMRDISMYFNHTMDYVQQLQESFVKKGSKPPRIIRVLQVFVMTYFIGLNLNIVLGFIIGVAFPDLPIFPSSVVANIVCVTDANGNICIRQITALIFAHLLMAHVLYVTIATSLLLALSGIPSIFHILVLIPELNSETYRITKPGLRHPNMLITKYRELQVYVDALSRVYSFGVAYNKIIILLVSIYAWYGALKLGGLLALFLGFTAVDTGGYLTVLFTALGEVHSRSTALQSHWKSKMLVTMGKGKYFRRCLKSMPILKMDILKFYYVDKPLILTMFQFVLESLVDLLILYP